MIDFFQVESTCTVCFNQCFIWKSVIFVDKIYMQLLFHEWPYNVVTTFADRMIFIILTFFFSILRSHNLDWSYLFFVINGKETKNQYFCVLFITKKKNSIFFSSTVSLPSFMTIMELRFTKVTDLLRSSPLKFLYINIFILKVSSILYTCCD